MSIGLKSMNGTTNKGYEEFKNLADINKEHIPAMLNGNREYRRAAKRLQKINRRK